MHTIMSYYVLGTMAAFMIFFSLFSGYDEFYYLMINDFITLLLQDTWCDFSNQASDRLSSIINSGQSNETPNHRSIYQLQESLL
jgi:hypothetical protein